MTRRRKSSRIGRTVIRCIVRFRKELGAKRATRRYSDVDAIEFRTTRETYVVKFYSRPSIFSLGRQCASTMLPRTCTTRILFLETFARNMIKRRVTCQSLRSFLSTRPGYKHVLKDLPEKDLRDGSSTPAPLTGSNDYGSSLLLAKGEEEMREDERGRK